MGNYKSKKDNKNDKNNRDKDNINKFIIPLLLSSFNLLL